MKSMNKVLFVLSVFCTVFLLSAAAEIPVNAAELFDPIITRLPIRMLPPLSERMLLRF